MSILNWKVFGLKYDQKENSAFEDLSYLLFCAELENRIGLFRYKNQAGLETEPIAKDGVVFGFQAKHYTTSVSKNKIDIIDSIQKAQKTNAELNKLYFYLNKELSESSSVVKKKTQYQIEIEKEAEKLNIEIVWRVPSHFELQLALPENKYIHDLFFSLNPCTGDLIDNVRKHTESILKSIQSEIIYGDKVIKIDRSDSCSKIKQAFTNNSHLIIAGEGGCGKTAIVKDLYINTLNEVPVCLFKASELNLRNINELFRFDHNYSFDQFIDSYKSEPLKVFIIDSAEKLPELNNLDLLHELIRSLHENEWKLIFTTRNYYLEDLRFHIKQTYQLSFDSINISHLVKEELEELKVSYGFSLPTNSNFRDRIKNLFYLNEYIQQYQSIDKNGNLNSFIDLIWKKRIQNISFQKDNLHIERERSFLKIVKDRCNSGLFYINIEQLNQSAIYSLKQDEIIEYDVLHAGCYITHDIYEEWALSKIINQAFANYIDAITFFDEIGCSLPMRRAFRFWMSEQILEDINRVKELIQEGFKEDIAQFWKDELIVSILLSDFSESFFNLFDQEIRKNDFTLFKRIIFLLRIGCKEEDVYLLKLIKDQGLDYIFLKPKGKGWDEVIKYTYTNKELLLPFLDVIIPILEDWNSNVKRGETTRVSTLLALFFYESFEKRNSYTGAKKKILISIILNGALEVKEELKVILEDVVGNKWKYHSNPHYDLCHEILISNNHISIVFALPIQVLRLLDLYWLDQKDSKSRFPHSSMGVERYYSIDEHWHLEYRQSSALQTPIYWLLRSSTNDTLNFILNFVNTVIENYSKSDVQDPVDEVDIVIDEHTIVKQYLNITIWCMYRGSGGIAKPNVLESIHMALERFLLEIAAEGRFDIVEPYLIYLLKGSKSTSLTSIVASLVLAYPDKLFNVALVLFKTLKLFHIDGTRQLQESTAKSLYSIGYGLNEMKKYYADERLKTCEDKHRNLNLESIFVNYQFCGVKGFSDEENSNFIDRLHSIIDCHKATINIYPSEEQAKLNILLTRIDRRMMKPKVEKVDDSSYIIDLNPQLTQELKEHSENAVRKYEEMFKYSHLMLWSMNKNSGDDTANSYAQFDKNPHAALIKAKEIIVESGNPENKLMPTDLYIPAFVCAALLRFYSLELSEEELDYCKEVVLSRVCSLFSDDYGYQIHDGVEASVHSIPFLMKLFPEEIPIFKRILLYALFDMSKIGEYKRICDYVIEAIHQECHWATNTEDIKSLIYAYIKFKPLYNESSEEEIYPADYLYSFRRLSKENRLSKIEEDLQKIDFNDLKLNTSDLDDLINEDMSVIFQLIPDNTEDEELVSIVKQMLPRISNLLIETDKHESFHLPLIRHIVFKKFTQFLLFRNLEDIKEYIDPFINKITGSEESEAFIGAIVSSQCNLGKYDQFWTIWKLLYSPIIDACNTGYHSNKVLVEYLLAWRWWVEGIKEWESLKENNLWLYNNVSTDIGHKPVVLFSISRVLNTIGFNFVDQGINWIFSIMKNNEGLILGDYESNTLYYLECYLRRFVYKNKERIKKEIRLKKQVVLILEFMINRGSVHAYQLRESIM